MPDNEVYDRTIAVLKELDWNYSIAISNPIMHSDTINTLAKILYTIDWIRKYLDINIIKEIIIHERLVNAKALMYLLGNPPKISI